MVVDILVRGDEEEGYFVDVQTPDGDIIVNAVSRLGEEAAINKAKELRGTYKGAEIVFNGDVLED